MEMSGKAKPLTSFFIEDILSFKDSSSCGTRCSRQEDEEEEEEDERSPQWEEEPQMLSAKLCSQESELGEQSGERLLKFLE